MSTQEAASLATKEANPVIDGRKANVNLAYLGAKPRVIPSPAGKFNLIESIENGHILFVSNGETKNTQGVFRMLMMIAR